MNNVRSEADLARQGKLKHLNGSEHQVNAIAAKTSVMALLPSSQQVVPILRTLCSPSDLGGLNICDRNIQRHVVLQHYTCKCLRLQREASGLHNL